MVQQCDGAMGCALNIFLYMCVAGGFLILLLSNSLLEHGLCLHQLDSLTLGLFLEFLQLLLNAFTTSEDENKKKNQVSCCHMNMLLA